MLTMITKPDIAALILDACPSFRAAFIESCSNHGEDLLYVHAGALARHLLALHRGEQRDEFPAVGAFVERLHAEGSCDVREFATIGILESIQNVWANNNTDPDAFLPFLGPLGAQAWRDLNCFWNGEIPHVPDTPNA